MIQGIQKAKEMYLEEMVRIRKENPSLPIEDCQRKAAQAIMEREKAENIQAQLQSKKASENEPQYAKNSAAVALGKMARGVPKTLTEEQRQRKREIVAANRAKIIKKHPAADFYRAHREELASPSKTMPTLLYGRIVGPPNTPITTLTIQIPIHTLKWLEDYTAQQRTLPETFVFDCLMHVIGEVAKSEKGP